MTGDVLFICFYKILKLWVAIACAGQSKGVI